MKISDLKVSLCGLFVFVCMWLVPVTARSSDEFQNRIPESIVDRLEKAERLRKSGDYEAAISDLEEILNIEQRYYKAYVNLGLARYANSEYEKSLDALKKAVEIVREEEIQDYRIFNTIGWVNLEYGFYEEAEKYFKIALEHEDKLEYDHKKVIYNNLGLLQLYIGDLDMAEKYLTIAVEEYGNEGAKRNLEIVHEARESQQRGKSSSREILKEHVRWSIEDQGAQVLRGDQLLPVDEVREALLATQPEGRLGHIEISQASDDELTSVVREILDEKAVN